MFIVKDLVSLRIFCLWLRRPFYPVEAISADGTFVWSYFEFGSGIEIVCLKIFSTLSLVSHLVQW